MMVVVTGGSGSGKSAFAEEKVLSFGEMERFYIATMYPYDEESYKRIKRHQNMRAGKKFHTVEKYTDVGSISFPGNSTVLLECMSNLTANEMFLPEGAGMDCAGKVIRDIGILKEKVQNLVIVTNEIFSDAGAYEEETRRYLKNLGEINQGIAGLADELYEVVYGIPVRWKGEAFQ
ncbi:MAG: bifunctional adenosylcobinamide kinase/adenosylcobinamide-phosphate guanylyltransferase [Blautia sp.]|nr:bifunctional adenosylcobinamide kinase/adenosylcobinamide-phosphate guanylyltransferase [Blautia sp.]